VEERTKKDKNFRLLGKSRKLIPCSCGCGELIIDRDYDGRPRKFKLNHQSRKEANPKWKGGIKRDPVGYIFRYKPDHHFANNKRYVLEHRLVWEEYNKAILLPWGHIHHKNEIKNDNRIENLEAMMGYQHPTHHKKDMSDRRCSICNTDKGEVYKHKNGTEYISWRKLNNGWLCRKCYDKYRVRDRSVSRYNP
jgi:hypothetical protein